MNANPPLVVPLDLGVSTAYAIRGPQRTVLVDSGPAGTEARLLRKVGRAGIDPQTIALIVLTHCHPDHAGGAAELRQRLGVPVAVHRAEIEWARTGHSAFYQPVRPFGHLLARMLKPSFPAFVPDVVLEHGDRLDEHGVPLTALHTPGHTPGSITLLHRPGGDALVGDLLAGGFLRADRPGLPFLADDITQIAASVSDVLAAAPSRLLFGHGKPASALSTLRRFGPLPSPRLPARPSATSPSDTPREHR